MKKKQKQKSSTSKQRKKESEKLKLYPIKNALPFAYDSKENLFKTVDDEYIKMIRINGINLFGMKNDDQEMRMIALRNLFNPIIRSGQIYAYEVPADVDAYVDDYENMKSSLELRDESDKVRYEILDDNQRRLSETSITRELVDRCFVLILKDKDISKLDLRINNAKSIMSSYNLTYELSFQEMAEIIYSYYNPRNSVIIKDFYEDNPDIMDLIYPDQISYIDRQLRQYINLNGVYCQTLYVSRFTKKDMAYLSSLACNTDIEFSLHFEQAPKNEIKKVLDSSLKANKKNLQSSKEGSEEVELGSQQNDIVDLIEQINVDDDIPFYFSASIRVKAETMRDLLEFSREIKEDLNSKGFKVRSGIFQALDLFNLTAPICCNKAPVYMKQTTSDTLGWGYPFVHESLYDHTEMMDANGNKTGQYYPAMYLGNTITTNGAVLYDNFVKKRDRANYNEFITGKTGFGKTTLMMNMIKFRHSIGYKQYLLDVEAKALNKLTHELKGSNVNCANGENGRINPLQVRIIVPDDETMQERKVPLNKIKPLNSHVRSMRSFYRSYNENPSSFANQHYSILEDSLFFIYKAFGIDQLTTADKIIEKTNEEFPIFLDQYNELLNMRDIEMSETYPNMNKIKVLDECIAFIKPLAVGADAEVFNGHTNIDESNRLICFNFAGLHDNTSSTVLSTQYLNVLTYIWSKIVSSDGSYRTQVYEDELAVIQNPNYREVMIVNESMVRRVRKYMTGMTFGTQQLIDMIKASVEEFSKTLINQSSNKFYFGLDSNSLEYLSNNDFVPQSEIDAIHKFEIGQCFLSVGSQTSMRVNIELDQKTLQQFDRITAGI